MARATTELDFFGMDKLRQSCKLSQSQKLLDRRRSFRGLQDVISKMNPELVKSVIASGLRNQSKDSVNHRTGSEKQAFSVPSTPKEAQTQALFPTLPLLSPSTRNFSSENGSESTPLTIFYNGTVSVFNVPRDKAESIFKLASEGSSKKIVENSTSTTDHRQVLLETLNGDLPITRRKSLQRFLEKRKERLTSVSPYAC